MNFIEVAREAIRTGQPKRAIAAMYWAARSLDRESEVLPTMASAFCADDDFDIALALARRREVIAGTSEELAASRLHQAILLGDPCNPDHSARKALVLVSEALSDLKCLDQRRSAAELVVYSLCEVDPRNKASIIKALRNLEAIGPPPDEFGQNKQRWLVGVACRVLGDYPESKNLLSEAALKLGHWSIELSGFCLLDMALTATASGDVSLTAEANAVAFQLLKKIDRTHSAYRTLRAFSNSASRCPIVPEHQLRSLRRELSSPKGR